MKNGAKLLVPAIALLFTSCLGAKSDTDQFRVCKISSTSKGEFIYNLNPLDGWGNIQILSDKRYNVGDTLNIRP